jgi:1-acyl-sn-glycerol-3-phosphate acyltransferase
LNSPDTARTGIAPDPPLLLLILRSIVVHVAIWIMVLVFGTLVIFLSPFSGGQICFFLGNIWGLIIMWMAGVKLEVVGAEHLQHGKPQVLVGNHASNFDIYAMMVVLKDLYYRFLPKHEIIYMPIFGWALWAARFPFIDRRNPAKAHHTMNKLAERMKRTGLSIVAFPEGTRNRTAQLMLPFKKGPFIVATEVKVPILPFVLHGAREVQGRHNFLICPGTIRVEFLEPMPTEGLSYQDRNELLGTARSRIEEALLRGPRKVDAT